MGASCCQGGCQPPSKGTAPRFRRMLWAALVINAAMFIVEIVAGMAAGSSSLQADSLDFLGDAANYAVSLFVLGMSLRRRAQASVIKGATMGAFGLWVIGNTLLHALNGTVPESQVMGAVGIAAFIANAAVAIMLYAFREGDSNMRSVWVCSRNDAIGNLAVLAAAGGVFASGSGWPDFAVAGIMAALALSGAFQVLRYALAELRYSPVVQG